MKNRSFPHRLAAAYNGIRSTWKSERSFRTQCFFASGAALLLGICHPGILWFVAFGLTIGSVLAFELVNTALEHVVDRLHPEQDPAIGLAKDCAAGAVLVMSTVSLLVLICFVVRHYPQLISVITPK